MDGLISGGLKTGGGLKAGFYGTLLSVEGLKEESRSVQSI